ncbi:hypothetical protein FKM82_002783 [Ascaphus truei]
MVSVTYFYPLNLPLVHNRQPDDFLHVTNLKLNIIDQTYFFIANHYSETSHRCQSVIPPSPIYRRLYSWALPQSSCTPL